MYDSEASENSRRKMPFGKFKGIELSQVPQWYLTWLVHQDFVRDPLRSDVERILDGRHQPDPALMDRLEQIDRLVKSVDEQLDREGG